MHMTWWNCFLSSSQKNWSVFFNICMKILIPWKVRETMENLIPHCSKFEHWTTLHNLKWQIRKYDCMCDKFKRFFYHLAKANVPHDLGFQDTTFFQVSFWPRVYTRAKVFGFITKQERFSIGFMLPFTHAATNPMVNLLGFVPCP
jgi:hypothetical protein